MKRYSDEDLRAIEARKKQAQNRVVYVHLGLNQDQQRRKNRSNGNFDSPKAACGNGSFHAKCDSRKGRVTCPHCLDVIKANPHYL